MDKKLIIILIIVILAGLGLALHFLKQPVPSKVSLFLSTPKRSYKVNKTIPVVVKISTLDYEVAGTDVVLNYDPQRLQFQKIESSNSVFKNFPPHFTSEGKIRFSALADPQEKFKGSGEVATILFQTIKKGRSNISFDFTSGSTTDTNIALYGEAKDILENVNNLKVEIK